MSAERKPKLFDPTRPPEPKYFTRVPDDALEDPRLSRSDQAIFAQLLKGHWVDNRRHTITQTELAKRCRISVRRLRPHLVKLEKLEYISRLRIAGRDTLISLTFQLRPILELAPDEHGLPVTMGNREVGPKRPTHRTQTSDPSDPNVRPIGPKRPTSPTVVYKGTHANSEREEEKEEERGKKEIPAGTAAPPSSLPGWDDKQRQVLDVATSRWGASNGDFIVGDLLRGYSAELVMEAIDRHFAKVGPAIKPALLMATCRGMLADGWKPEGPSQRRSTGSVPYKPEGPVAPPVAPLTEEQRVNLKIESERVMAQQLERARNGRKHKQEE